VRAEVHGHRTLVTVDADRSPAEVTAAPDAALDDAAHRASV